VIIDYPLHFHYALFHVRPLHCDFGAWFWVCFSSERNKKRKKIDTP